MKVDHALTYLRHYLAHLEKRLGRSQSSTERRNLRREIADVRRQKEARE